MMTYLADFPDLLDLMAAHQDNADGSKDGGALGGSQKHLFTPHLPMDDLLHGIKNKKYYKGE
jgi:hypothetical protein